jgi:hypothetical protein
LSYLLIFGEAEDTAHDLIGVLRRSKARRRLSHADPAGGGVEGLNLRCGLLGLGAPLEAAVGLQHGLVFGGAEEGNLWDSSQDFNWGFFRISLYYENIKKSGGGRTVIGIMGGSAVS